MSDKKHIDRLFQEKFKDFNVSPDDNVWEAIEARLQNKKKRRIIPFWWQLGSVAAALILLFAIGNLLVENTPKDEIPTVVNTENQKEYKKIKSKSENSLFKENEAKVASDNSIENGKKPNSSEKVTNKPKNQKQPYNISDEESVIASQDSEKNNKSSLPITNDIKKTTNVVASVSKKKNQLKENKFESQDSKTKIITKDDINALLKSNTTKESIASVEKNKTTTEEDKRADLIKEEEKGQDIEEALAEANTINEKEEEKLRRWSVSPNVAPVLFNSFGQGSSIDNQFDTNERTSDVTLSVGIKGSYAVNKRLKITTGINRVSFNSNTSDIIALSDNSFVSSASDNNLENVELNSNVNDESLLVVSRTSLNNNSVSGAINTIQTGDINQNFGFIEIPVELEYRVIDKKIGLNLSGGFSTLFLNENEIFADVNGQSTSIGEANNIKNTSFSANIGLGLDYGLTEKININLEPKFKYQLNTFNNTSGDFRPFFIGIYTGLSFKF